MKVKRDKSVRRRMAMYSHVFGIREPYRVLCDGNFLQVKSAESQVVGVGPDTHLTIDCLRLNVSYFMIHFGIYYH